MKSLFEILEKLKLDISTDLPALLIAAGLTDFAVYDVGKSRNSEELGFFIYQDNQNFSNNENSISVMFQIQLYQIDELIAAKYSDVITGYMSSYDTFNLGCDLLTNMNAEYWPIEQSSTTFIIVTLNWIENLDSCS